MTNEAVEAALEKETGTGGQFGEWESVVRRDCCLPDENCSSLGRWLVCGLLRHCITFLSARRPRPTNLSYRQAGQEVRDGQVSSKWIRRDEGRAKMEPICCPTKK